MENALSCNFCLFNGLVSDVSKEGHFLFAPHYAGKGI